MLHSREIRAMEYIPTTFVFKGEDHFEMEVDEMKGKVLAITAIAATLIVAGIIAYAGPWGFRGWGSGFGAGPMMMGGGYHYGYGPGMGFWSTLTDEQRQKIEELRSKFLSETAEIRGKLQAKSIELRNLWTDPEASEEEILAKSAEVKDLRDQLYEISLKCRLEIRKLLTPEQLKRIGFGFGGRRGFGPWGGLKAGRGARGGFDPHGPHRWCW